MTASQNQYQNLLTQSQEVVPASQCSQQTHVHNKQMFVNYNYLEKKEDIYQSTLFRQSCNSFIEYLRARDRGGFWVLTPEAAE